MLDFYSSRRPVNASIFWEKQGYLALCLQLCAASGGLILGDFYCGGTDCEVHSFSAGSTLRMMPSMEAEALS